MDANASGVFFIDIKESGYGEPCITKINTGRFATITNIQHLAGKYNMAVTVVRLALGEPIKIRNSSDFAEGYYLVRSDDTLPAAIHKDDLFEASRMR